MNLCWGHYVMSASLRYLFPVPLHSSLYFHVLLMLLSYSDVYFILISKYFLGRLSLLRNYKLKSVADITLRTLHIGFIDFIQLRILFQLFSKFSWPFSACLRHCNWPCLQSTTMNFYLEEWKRRNWVAGQGFCTVEHAQNCL